MLDLHLRGQAFSLLKIIPHRANSTHAQSLREPTQASDIAHLGSLQVPLPCKIDDSATQQSGEGKRTRDRSRPCSIRSKTAELFLQSAKVPFQRRMVPTRYSYVVWVFWFRSVESQSQDGECEKEKETTLHLFN